MLCPDQKYTPDIENQLRVKGWCPKRVCNPHLGPEQSKIRKDRWYLPSIGLGDLTRPRLNRSLVPETTTTTFLRDCVEGGTVVHVQSTFHLAGRKRAVSPNETQNQSESVQVQAQKRFKFIDEIQEGEQQMWTEWTTLSPPAGLVEQQGENKDSQLRVWKLIRGSLREWGQR